MAVALGFPKFYGFNENGDPLSGGKLYTYEAGTNDDKTTWQDEAQTIPNTNPVILNDAGFASVFFSGSYNFVLTAADDSAVWSQDPVTSALSTEWVDCQAATYVSPTSFTVAGNQAALFDVNRQLRLEAASEIYTYDFVVSAVFAGSLTTVETRNGQVPSGLTGVCRQIMTVPRLPFNEVAFDSVASMKAESLQSGEFVLTRSYLPSWVSGSAETLGGAKYQIVTASEYTAITGRSGADGYADHELTNGNIAILVPEIVGRINMVQCGAMGDDSTDNTDVIQAMIDNYIGERQLWFPSGVYQYTQLTGLDVNETVIIGEGSQYTVLKCISAGVGLDIGTLSGFRQGMNLVGLTIEGNEDTTVVLRATAIARSHWDDVNVREADNTAGVGVRFRGCSLNTFKDVVCSTDRQAMDNIPNIGCAIDAQSPFGNSSNNSFINLYCEGPGRVTETMEIGLQITGGDQNVFIAGSPESCGTWGMTINGLCRYNTFIGVGFENLDATSGDFSDGGICNQFINCYASDRAFFQGQNAQLSGGYFERVEVGETAQRTRISNIIVNNWDTGAGGLFDSGIGTEAINVYDIDTATYIEDIRPSFLALVPVTLNNVTGDGTAYTLTDVVEIFDRNNNVSGGVFTAPVSGQYQLNVSLSLDGLDGSHTNVVVEIVTTARSYRSEFSAATGGSKTQENASLAVIAAMEAGNTAFVRMSVAGSGATVDIIGNATLAWSTFSGSKV